MRLYILLFIVLPFCTVPPDVDTNVNILLTTLWLNMYNVNKMMKVAKATGLALKMFD